MDFLLNAASPEALNPPSSDQTEISQAPEAPVVTQVEVAPTAASRAYSLLVSSVLPAASTALGSIVNTVSSTSIWKQVFGEKGEPEDKESVFTKLIETEGSIKDFALRILGQLYDAEVCCSSECWSKFCFILTLCKAPVQLMRFSSHVRVMGICRKHWDWSMEYGRIFRLPV